MLIVASAKDLAKAAATAAEMALHNSPYAILNNLLLTARDGEVSFSGSNLEGHMTVTCRAEETKPGSIAVDARIAKLLASFTDGALAKIVHADGITTLSCGRARYRIETLPAEDFPSAFDTNSVAELTLSDTERRRSFGVPAPAVSDEKMRFYLLGINLKVDTGQLVACATDGHILIKTSVTPGCELPDSLTCAPESYNKLKADISELEASISELESDIPDSEGDSGIGIANLKWKLADARKTQSQALSGVIVPKDACASIAKMDGCIIRLASNCIEAATASQRLVHKLIEGTFPDYKRVIPPPTGNTCKVDRKELLDAINRMSNVVSSEKNITPAVVFDWEDDQLSLSLGRQLDAGSDVLSAVTSGRARTAFSIRLIGRLLGAISSEMVEFDSGSYGAPVLVSSPGDDGLVAIVMPIRIDEIMPRKDDPEPADAAA